MSPLSGVLGEAWTLYRRHARHFIMISFVIFLVIAIIDALLSWALGLIGGFIGWIFLLFGVFLLQAALVKAVQDVRDGRADLDLRATLEAAVPFVGAVAIASILAGIGIGIGFVLIIVPGLILLTFWSLIVPEIVIGGAGAFDSFGRSWRTVRGYAWNVFGCIVVVYLIQFVAELVVSLILSALPYAWRSFVSELVVGALVAPFTAAVVALIYYRLTAAHGQPAEPGQGYGSGQGGYGSGPGYGSGQGGYGSGPGYGSGQGGYGSGQGGYGSGQGGYGSGPGYGSGQGGYGPGPGYGSGQGGYGPGQGYGPGPDQGYGPGSGQGYEPEPPTKQYPTNPGQG